MDWWKLFALLAALASVFSPAEGAKKKIRIHLPQKVKHIHHHKKIYITNHPAASQYAPAYLQTADSSVLSGGVALPATLVPLKSELLDERRRPLAVPAARPLLPLYRARGYYGPNPNEWDEQEFDIASPEPTAAAYVPSAFSAPSGPAPSPSYAPAPSYAPKRVKLLKVKESPRKKKIIRKRKPKRVVNNIPPVEEDHPVSSFHEQFYSDIENTGTIKKIRKPKRVEKIIDGDTEHIHTYSEEHIHKVVFDDAPKLTGLAGGDPLGSMSALAAAHPLVPLKNHQSLLAADAYALGGGGGGSHGTPSHLEYAAYNPREVTHDHIIHDHGELPPNVDLLRDSLGYPKASYTSSGLKLNGRPLKSTYRKPTRPSPVADFSYYESMYDQNGRPKPKRYPLRYNSEPSAESNIDDFRPIPAFRFKDSKPKRTPSVLYYGQTATGKAKYPLGQASVPVPFSTASSTAQDYTQANSYAGVRPASPTSFSNFKDPFASYRNVYSNNFEYDTYASSSNFNNRGNEAQSVWPTQSTKGKQKSISSQNVNFGGQDHQTVVDHLAESSQIQAMYNKDGQSQATQFEGFDNSKPIETATPTTHFTITENSPAHGYYTAMAEKAFEEDPLDPLALPEASNDHYQFAVAPETTPSPLVATAEAPRPFHRHQSVEDSSPPPSEAPRKAPKRRRQRNNKASTQAATERPHYPQGLVSHPVRSRLHSSDDTSTRGKLKYGDKI